MTSCCMQDTTKKLQGRRTGTGSVRGNCSTVTETIQIVSGFAAEELNLRIPA